MKTTTRRRSTAAVLLAVVGSAVIATTALGGTPSWTPATTIRSANDLRLWDSEFAHQNVAIAWDEPGATFREVGIRTSVDSGSSFGPTSWFSESREPAVDICNDELHAVMAHRNGPSNWFLEHVAGSIDGTAFVTTPVAPSAGVQSRPDVTCAGGRVFVSWFEEGIGSGHRMFVAHARRAGGPFSMFIDLGFDNETEFFSSLAVAGVKNRAYAVFQQSDGDLRFMRWSVGSAPGFNVTAHPTQVIAPGTPDNPASYAVIAAAGDKVAVSWFKCGGLFARVSNDRGQTWGPARKLIQHSACGGDFVAVQESIAIRDGRIVIAYTAAGIVGDGEVGLLSTTNDFASYSDDMIATRFHAVHQVGFVTVAGQVKLAAAFERPDRVRFRRQL